jgi:hypothetical protein
MRLCRKNIMSYVPVSAPPAAPFRLWMRDSKGLISSILASVGGESHDINFVRPLVASKGAIPNLSEEEVFWSLI